MRGPTVPRAAVCSLAEARGCAAAFYSPLTTYYLLLTTYYLLLTTYYSLLTTHCLLLTAYYSRPTHGTYYALRYPLPGATHCPTLDEVHRGIDATCYLLLTTDYVLHMTTYY